MSSQIIIVENETQTIKNYQAILNNDFFKIYINDNDINTLINVATFVSQLNVKFKKYLNIMQQLTIYFEKLKSIDMICQFALNYDVSKLYIFVDN